jgi:hypothetical protein
LHWHADPVTERGRCWISGWRACSGKVGPRSHSNVASDSRQRAKDSRKRLGLHFTAKQQPTTTATPRQRYAPSLGHAIIPDCSSGETTAGHTHTWRESLAWYRRLSHPPKVPSKGVRRDSPLKGRFRFVVRPYIVAKRHEGTLRTPLVTPTLGDRIQVGRQHPIATLGVRVE